MSVPSPTAVRKPNIIVYLADQLRWDFVGANGLNSSVRTPNIDSIARRGTNFTLAVTNQPVCAPARSVIMTSRYATETGVWHNGPGLRADLPTLAGELCQAGYSANYIGKWHLAPADHMNGPDGEGVGYVPPQHRGGFDDLWEASNLLEFTSHPFEGELYDGEGNAIAYKDRYRVDFLTDRAERFLRQPHDRPFFLFIAQLEPHHQNDMGRVVGPEGSAERYATAFVPPDLRALPGDWGKELPDYYGATEAIDTSVGRIRRVLQEEQIAGDTVFVFLSDHGCHFRTRNEEFKRSAHNSSIRIPLLIEGPGFEGAREVPELVSILHLAPTLLDIAGASAPESWRGRSLMPLLTDPDAREHWPNRELIQISESMTARAIRTPDWTYCAADMSGDTSMPGSASYQDYQLYDQRADPNELVNLAGRNDYRLTADALREQLKKLVAASGEPEPEITPAKLYP